MKKLLAAFTATASLFACGVLHANEANWTGVSVGVGIGAGAAVHDLTIVPTVPVPFSAGFDGIGGEGVLGTVSLGADYQFARSWVIGAFVDYDFTDIETTLGINAFGTTINGAIRLDDMWTVGGRIGYLTSPTTLVYGLVGYTHANVDDITFTATPGGSLTIGVPSFDGWSVGGGMETSLAKNLTLKGEYRYTELDRGSLDLSVIGAGLPIDIGLEPSIHSGRLSINYKFNFDRGHATEPLK